MANITNAPLMEQYKEMKTKHPDAILLFRVGDFYETFGEDAITLSEICGVTLTRRANGSAASIELAGFPHHALDTYLPKLIKAGRRTCICEQLEDKQEVVEKVTPNEEKQEKTEPTIKVKEINCFCGIEQMREKGEPIAYFTIDIPKEAKNIGKCINKKKNFNLPQLHSICIEPENNKIIATDTHVLQTLDAKCSGVWPEGKEAKIEGLDTTVYHPFQCNIDPKAINALAGKSVDVAVWEKDGKLDITACETDGVRSQYAESGNPFPNWQRVVSCEFEKVIRIEREDVSLMLTWLKKNVGKTTPDSRGDWAYNNHVKIELTDHLMKLTIRVHNNDEWKWEEGESYTVAHDSKIEKPLTTCFVAPLMLLSIDGDFNGKIGFNKQKPSMFFGKYRDSLIMPLMITE